jgi:hypothetical protein
MHMFRPALGPTQPSVRRVLGYSQEQSARGVALTTYRHGTPGLKEEQIYSVTPSAAELHLFTFY